MWAALQSIYCLGGLLSVRVTVWSGYSLLGKLPSRCLARMCSQESVRCTSVRLGHSPDTVFKICLEYIFKTFLRDVFKTKKYLLGRNLHLYLTNLNLYLTDPYLENLYLIKSKANPKEVQDALMKL